MHANIIGATRQSTAPRTALFSKERKSCPSCKFASFDLQLPVLNSLPSLLLSSLLLPSLLLPLPLTDVDQLSWVKWREGLILQYGNLNLMTIEELKDSLFPNQQTRAGVKIFKDGHWDPIRYISCTIYSFQYSKVFFAGGASSSLYFVHVFAYKNHNSGSACVCSSAITDYLSGLASLANSGKIARLSSPSTPQLLLNLFIRSTSYETW